MADDYIVLSHTREGGEIKIGKALPSRLSDSKEIFFPAREMDFHRNKVIFRESNIDGGKGITVFGFKQSMLHESGRDYRQDYLGYEDIDVKYVQDIKAQTEIVEKIRRSIPMTDMIKYKSLIVEFWGKKPKSYALIKHRDFGRLSK